MSKLIKYNPYPITRAEAQRQMGRQSYKSKHNYNGEKGTTETPPHHTPAAGGKAILVAHRIEGKG